MISSAPAAIRKLILQRTAKRKIFRASGFAKLPAAKVLRQGQALPGRPPLFEPEQLERVISCGFGHSVREEVARLTATHFMEGVPEEYDLGPCVIAGGQIFSETETYYFSDRSPLKAMRGPLQKLGPIKLASTEQGVKYFGHWLRDDCALYELIRDDGKIWSLTRPHWPDTQIYEAAFDQDWTPLDFAFCENLTVYRELGFNRDKSRRFDILRQKLRDKHPQHEGGKIVYLSRGATSSPRNMSNAAAFEAELEKAGIQIVEPEIDPASLPAKLLNAKMIITIEGSQAAHGVYMLGKGGSMLILQPPERFYNAHQEWTRVTGMKYGTVVGTKDNTSFHVSPSEVLAMVDRLEKA